MHPPDSRRSWLTRWWSSPRERVLGVFALLVVALASLTLSRSMTSLSQAAFASSWRLNKVGAHVNPFRTRRALLDSGLPIYDLKIKPAELRKVDGIVSEASRRGVLGDDLKQWSKAEFVRGTETRKVKVRVRGDLPLHWRGERKSWRVRFRDEEPLDGRSEINFIVTADSKALSEYFTNAVFRELGVLTLRDEYAVLRINGVPRGVYYVVEHPTAAMLAHRGRMESSVFTRPVGMFKEQVTDGDPMAVRALQALRDFEDDPTEERFRAATAVTDMDDYVRFLAGTTLFASDHTYLAGDNHKVYYDASRGQFARIAWDVLPRRLWTPVPTGLNRYRNAIDLFEVFPMSEFRKAVLTSDAWCCWRNHVLWDLVRDDRLLEELDDRYERLELPLWADVMGAGDEPDRIATLRRTVARNIAHIQRCLSNNRGRLRVRQENVRTASLQFTIESLSGIRLREIRLEQPEGASATYRLIRDDDGNGAIDEADTVLGSLSVEPGDSGVFEGLDEALRPRMRVEEDVEVAVQSGADGGAGSRKRFQTVVYPEPRRCHYFLVRHAATAEWPVVSVVAENAVTGTPVTDGDMPMRSFLTDDFYDPMLRNREVAVFLRDTELLVAHPTREHAVTLRAANVPVEGVVIVPEGVTLVIEPGTVLRMGAGASIVAFGPIEADGTSEAPIRVVAATSAPWGAIASVNAGGTCLFRNVHVSGGGGAVAQGVVLSGSIAIHNGDAVIHACRFVGAKSEDALNIKDGRVTLTDTYFADNMSDGVDLDFVTGEVRGCHYAGHGGDAIDTSGATLVIADCRIERSFDKGISVGERSDVKIENNLLLDNAIAVAVKDLSRATIQHCTMVGNTTSIAAYRKKPIFGGGEAVVIESVLIDSANPVSVDSVSTVRLARSVVPGHYRADECEIASPDLSAALRSHDFVCNFDRNSAAGDGSGGADTGAYPGIRLAPVDLR